MSVRNDPRAGRTAAQPATGRVRPMIIAIAGLIGVGKSTVARRLAERFGLRYVSAGEVFRDLARRKSLSVLEINRLAESQPELDRDLDRMQAERAREGPCVVESRLAGWMVQADVKVWLRAPIDVRAGRVAAREGMTVEDARSDVESREESERRRYRELYGIDINDLSPYDLVIDTSRWDVESIVDAIALFAVTARPRGEVT